MNILTVEGLTKGYSERVLIKDISFSVNDGDKIGLIGVNGTGKSTLLKMIAGLETPDSGVITLNGNVKIGYLNQSPEFEPGTTVLEQVFKGDSPKMKLIRVYEEALQKAMDRPSDQRLQKQVMDLTQKMDHMDAWNTETEAKRILSKLGITDYMAEVSTLSGGQRKRVAMASVLISPYDLLILDEPTNHIDNETVDWLEQYLKTRKGALLIVTHDRYLLDRVSNKMLELHQGKVFTYQANYTKFLELKAEREELMESAERKRQNQIRRELAWIRRGARARSTKQKARLDRFEALTKEEKIYDAGKMEIQVGFSRLGKKIIEVQDVEKGYTSEKLIQGFSYTLLRDDRIGIIGPNGIGKTTLMKLITGLIEPDTGEVSIGETVKVGFFMQETDEMDPELRVIDYIREKAEYVTTLDGRLSASQMLETFMFPPSVQWTQIGKLSGGERRRLYLMKVLMDAPNVLILDEPTNDLDIQTLSILEEYIEAFPGAVIAVSHDRYFLDRIAERIFAFEGDGVIQQVEGNYSDYLSKRIPAQSVQVEQAAAKQIKEKEKSLKFSYKEKIEFEQIDGLIEELENRGMEIEEAMAQAVSDFTKLDQLTKEKAALDEELEQAYERWTYLNELNERIKSQKAQ